ncbi:MAG: hypothetical protein KKD27_12650 [Gammaproteobacteria bacterium]|uniref:hypothetical protein n=1 Tax=Stutzerimonas xanthomarina TaxID=271420 RepID=UPI0019096005|nr:hypothetical protein [Stutzerimonas xanthomarina]MBU0812556.1 hypothetical protein [Gammaproteobacteria bacterium]MBU0854017.1 hypothetical protein [Gammaproteobacteria bacterium]MBU1302239.1 hypothetical protein [Gammaproteobacteria bacterium]MBU1459617.1 hypothetical protein [Gammaproteobacteria bacterium]MBU1772829.1 hypothetical protein [Gammaproteobacteria bacterium]
MLIWQKFSGSIGVLLDNRYVFQASGITIAAMSMKAFWKSRFASGKRAAQLALDSGNTSSLLSGLFNRLHTLRNQLFHGGAN